MGLRLPFFGEPSPKHLWIRYKNRGTTDNIELDKVYPALLECAASQQYLGAREEGVTPSRSRRCKWGRNPRYHCPRWWMGRCGE